MAITLTDIKSDFIKLTEGCEFEPKAVKKAFESYLTKLMIENLIEDFSVSQNLGNIKTIDICIKFKPYETFVYFYVSV